MVNYIYAPRYYRDPDATDPLRNLSLYEDWFEETYGFDAEITIHGISTERTNSDIELGYDRCTYIYFETDTDIGRVLFDTDGYGEACGEFESVEQFDSEESMEADMINREMNPFQIRLRVIFLRSLYGCPCCNEEPQREEVVRNVTVQFLPASLTELDIEDTYENRESLMATECLSHPDLVR